MAARNEAEVLRSLNVGSNKDSFSKPDSAVIKFMSKWCDKIVKQLTTNLDKSGKNASSRLRQSIYFDVSYFGFILSFKLNMEDYWYWVDKGRKAGKVPANFEQTILKWIATKPSVQSKIPQKDRKRFAYLTARKIRLKGYKGSKFYSKVINNNEINNLKNNISKALKRDVIVDIQKTLNDAKKNLK